MEQNYNCLGWYSSNFQSILMNLYNKDILNHFENLIYILNSLSDYYYF